MLFCLCKLKQFLMLTVLLLCCYGIGFFLSVPFCTPDCLLCSASSVRGAHTVSTLLMCCEGSAECARALLHGRRNGVQQQMLRLQENPGKVLRMFRGIVRAYDPVWTDIYQLLDALFTLDEKRNKNKNTMILTKDWAVAQ